MAPPPPPPELNDDAIAEVLLRLPPDEPACLVRAALVCKPWRRILSDPAFPRRYRAFHRELPLLGFFHNSRTSRLCNVPLFVPATAPSPFPQPAVDYDNMSVLDCRHGRVLLIISGPARNLAVWDPITGHRQGLPENPISRDTFYTAAVLCAVRGCDHLDCHDGPFLVVLLTFDKSVMDLRAHLYSSEAGAWSAPAYQGLHHTPTRMPSVLIADDIYFGVKPYCTILRYNLGSNRSSIIRPPIEHETQDDIILMPMESGSLGLGCVSCLKLCLWSRDVDLEGVAEWVQFRVIELEKLITVMPFHEAEVVGSAERFGTMVLATDVATFTIDLNSGRVKMVGDTDEFISTYVFPFMAFYTPGCTSSKLPSLAGAC